MSDTTTPPPTGDENEALREEGVRALKAERETNKTLREELRQLKEWKESQESAGKSETEKLAAENAKLKADNATAAKEALRLRVAMKKGLTEKQAARLVGDDEESLLADADDLLSSFKPAEEKPEEGEGDAGPELDTRPKEKLKGGAHPQEEGIELDPAKLAANIAAVID